LVMIVIGLVHIVPSVIALKNGITILFGKAGVEVSPWFTLAFGCVFLSFGVAGAYKAWTDRNKYPF
jgi:hypothetical protein